MSTPTTTPARRRTTLLLVSLLLALGVVLVADRVIRLAPIQQAPPSRPAIALGDALPGWSPAGPAARYDADRLFEKINGQADLYLHAGFVMLDSQRFLDPADPSRSIELRAYEMGSAEAAASVHALQRRPGGEPLDPALDAECVAGSCFLSHGSWYLEVLPAPLGAGLDDRCRAAVFAFVEAHPLDDDAPWRPGAGFPAEGLEEGSVATGVRDAYGLAALGGVATATYQSASGPLLAWRAEAASPAAAEALAQRVEHELTILGAEPLEAPNGVRLLSIIGSACALQVTGSAVVGVQEAPDNASALALLDVLASQESTP